MFTFLDLGMIDYLNAQKIQRTLLEKRIKAEIQDTVLMLEHRPVVTIGRLGSIRSLKDPKALRKRRVKVIFTDRGGAATFHGPGQLVIYPIIDLKMYGKDVHMYIRFLETFGINWFKRYGLSAVSVNGKTGVWVDSEKIASIGIGIKKWVTFHGISLNINIDTRAFKFIEVCGDCNSSLTSLNKIIKKEPDAKEVKETLKDEFSNTFRKFYCGSGEKTSYKEVCLR